MYLCTTDIEILGGGNRKFCTFKPDCIVLAVNLIYCKINVLYLVCKCYIFTYIIFRCRKFIYVKRNCLCAISYNIRRFCTTFLNGICTPRQYLACCSLTVSICSNSHYSCAFCVFNCIAIIVACAFLDILCGDYIKADTRNVFISDIVLFINIYLRRNGFIRQRFTIV